LCVLHDFNNTVSVKSLFWSSLSFYSRFSGLRRYLVPAQRVSGAFLPPTSYTFVIQTLISLLSVAHRHASRKEKSPL
jgi:hypothetical protein